MSTIADVLANTHAWHIEQGDCRSALRTLPDDCVHCCVCSPAYFGLRSYLGKGDPAKNLELGLEPLHDCLGWASGTACGQCYVCHLIQVFREVHRVLHPSATLFLVLGDSYAGGGGGNYSRSPKQIDHGQHPTNIRNRDAWLQANHCKPKDLLGTPWRVALALQAEGWYLRSAITWAKTSAMPESVRDRPTRATEQIFLLAKSSRYSYDQEAERVPLAEGCAEKYKYPFGGPKSGADDEHLRTRVRGKREPPSGRNLWDYWEIPDEPLSDFWKLGPEPSKLPHYALFPSEIPRRCIRLGTSEKGCCPHCLAPWRRVIQRQRTHNGVPRDDLGSWRSADQACPETLQGDGYWRYASVTRTVGWEPCCDCPPHQPIPCLVLDCFSGLATTGLAARRLGRRYLGIELNANDVVMSERRIRQDNPLFHDVE